MSKMLKTKKVISGLVCVLAAVLMITACGEKNGGSNVGSVKLDKYPIETDAELTYWVGLNQNVSATASDMSETPFAKEMEKRTGVKIKYIHPALGQESEAFNLMIASNELPDIIETEWYNKLGGPTGAISDKVIISLNDIMDKYAPSFSGYLKENPEIDKAVKTDAGEYFGFPFIKNDPSLLVSAGPIVRKDWLDELGISMPQTIDDWENMLKAFRDKKGAGAPLSLAKSSKIALFTLVDASYIYYVDNGTVKYGPVQDEFFEALKTLNRWYSEGLLDKNYTLVDNTMLDSNVLNGKSGATYGSGGAQLGKWIETMENKGEKFELAGAPYPVLSDGTPNKYIYCNPYPATNYAAITTACKYPELAAKYLDYSYTEEGSILNNFGIENVSFKWVDGYPKYTDAVMNDPDGLTVSQTMGKYMRSNYLGPFVQDKRYFEQYYEKEEQKDALKHWMVGIEESKETMLPPVTLTVEESAEYTAIISEVNKYRDKMSAAFISGAESLDKYEEYLATMKKLGLDRATEIQQAAYDRFVNR